jgi:hypothetical protein
MRLKTIPESAMETEDQEGEIPVSFEEYQSLKAKAKELQALVNKRAAVGMAQVSEVYCCMLKVKNWPISASRWNIWTCSLTVIECLL